MIKKHVTKSARRARNIIWNAAGNYDFEPPFLAFFPNGAPDHYFNMVIGLAEKWLDLARISRFFDSYAGDGRADELDEFLWLGLENCLYEKEVEERPILAELRRGRAEQFFREQESLSRQQMEYQSMAVYSQQEARWAPLCGRHGPLLSPRERQMAEALRFSGTLDTDGVLAAMGDFLERFFRMRPGKRELSVHRVRGLGGLFGRRERRRRDHLLVRTGTGEGDHPRAVGLGHEGLGRYRPPGEKDEAFIRAVFGSSQLAEAEQRILEEGLCAGEDAACRVWITRGEGTDSSHREAANLLERRARQREKNLAFYRENAGALRSAGKALTTRLETVFSSYLKHLPEPARAGRICPEKAYRLPVLRDSRVFLKSGEETEQEIFVDVLLDASQSRMNSQEVLASEAYMVAKSLQALHIPVRVSAFRSLRGFTVLETLKGPGDRDCEGIFGYYAGGWNRDSLALRLLGRLDNEPALHGKQRILLIMTDASPNDSAPAAGGEGLRAREYEGTVAVEASQGAVRELRGEGIRVGAVFHGNPTHLGDLNRIYGHENVRIRRASQLAQGIGDLLLLMMREMRTD